jgi:hypothetical protein
MAQHALCISAKTPPQITNVIYGLHFILLYPGKYSILISPYHPIFIFLVLTFCVHKHVLEVSIYIMHMQYAHTI